MDIGDLSKTTVKIISQKIEINWFHPYKNKKTEKSIGTGFFIDNNGHILTNSHVVINSNKIFIEIPFLSSEKKEVKVINLCNDLDIALLKTVDYKNDEFFDLYDKDAIYDLKIGIDVYAIGFPLGQNHLKVTKGIISGRQNSLIQIDSAINPGNSGGPLLHNNKVIGINTSGIIFANNIGYATPISYYHIIKDLLYNKQTNIIKRPFLGLTYQNSTQELIYLNSKKCESGIIVQEVFDKSPISFTNIKQGDIISSFNNIKIDNFGAFDKFWFNEKMKLQDILLTIENDSIINIEYWRKNKLYKKNFKYQEFELEIRNKYPLYENIKIDYEIFGGLIIMELTNNHLSQIFNKLSFRDILNKNTSNTESNILKFSNNKNKVQKKLIITHIFQNSYIYNLDIINEFDIIKSVNNKETNTLDEYRKNIKNTIKLDGKKFIKISTDINKSIIVNLDKLLDSEKDFSKSYKYNISNLYTFFNKLVKKKTKKKLKK